MKGTDMYEEEIFTRFLGITRKSAKAGLQKSSTTCSAYKYFVHAAAAATRDEI